MIGSFLRVGLPICIIAILIVIWLTATGKLVIPGQHVSSPNYSVIANINAPKVETATAKQECLSSKNTTVPVYGQGHHGQVIPNVHFYISRCGNKLWVFYSNTDVPNDPISVPLQAQGIGFSGAYADAQYTYTYKVMPNQTEETGYKLTVQAQ